MMETAELLATGPFARLPPEQAQRLARLGGVEHVAAHQVVFREGDAADRFYVVLSGHLRVLSSPALDQEPVELRTLNAGEVFGEVALLDGGRRSATIEAVEDSIVFALNREAFLNELRESPELVSAMLTNLSEYVRSATERVVREELEQRALKAEMEVERFRSLTQLVAGVAHELNTPLGIVQTASSIIRQRLTSGGDTADVLEAARLLEVNVERAFRLVQSFKHVAAGSLTDPLEELNLVEVVQDAVSLFSLNARKARIEIDIRSEITDPRWIGYRGYLGQVLLNLLTNIERYAYPDSSGGKVDITLTATERVFELTVRDHGRGIAPESLPHVWDPFFTTGRAKGGTGLGLSIVRNIVTSRLSGEVALDSNPGLGTSVRVRMPRVISERRT
jgi:signal transduction histidine kinase